MRNSNALCVTVAVLLLSSKGSLAAAETAGTAPSAVSVAPVADTAEDHVKAADALHIEGYFDRARTEYEAALRSSPEDEHVLERLGFIYFFNGDYAKAVEYFDKVIRVNPERKRLMLAYTALAYYHRGRYADVVHILEETGPLNLLNIQQMRVLAKEAPYRIESNADQTILRFVQSDPLPVVQIEVNSKSLFVLIDTGGGQLIIDPEFAEEVGVRPVSSQETKGFAGGKAAEMSFGVAQSATLGEVTIRQVPVWILPTRPFSEDFGRRIDGVLGTEVLMQFLPTLDYPNQQLILRQKGNSSLAEGLAREAKTRIPFIIDGLHFMYAQCFLNERGPALMYFDSGLADEQGAALRLNSTALADLQIQEPARAEKGLGGGGEFAYGYVDIESVRVCDLVLRKQKATCSGGAMPQLRASGYKSYGILSHNYLKHYRWTIDFDKRIFLFQ